jgi:hypothetical protein
MNDPHVCFPQPPHTLLLSLILPIVPQGISFCTGQRIYCWGRGSIIVNPIMVTLPIVLLLLLQCWVIVPSVQAEGGVERITTSNIEPERHRVRGGNLRNRSSGPSSPSDGFEARNIKDGVPTHQRRLEDYGDSDYYYYYYEGKGKEKKKIYYEDDIGDDGEEGEWEETGAPSPTEESPAVAPFDNSDPNIIQGPTSAPMVVGDIVGPTSPVLNGIQTPPVDVDPGEPSSPVGSAPTLPALDNPETPTITLVPSEQPDIPLNPSAAPQGEVSDGESASSQSPSINVPETDSVIPLNPSPAPQGEVGDGDSASPQIPSVNLPETEGDGENDRSCGAAQSGEVYTTRINTTIYYQYELLTERSADLTNVVWPAVDEAFQKFLALTLVDCELGSNSPIQGVSPDPNDSFGTWYLDGRGNNCTGISEFDQDKLFCDVVTGSVTIFLSENFGGTIDDETSTYLDLRDTVFGSLMEEINHSERRRRRYLKGGSSFVDHSKGIYGLYFLSEPISSAAPETPVNENESPVYEPEANAVDSTTNMTSIETSEPADSSIPIIASFTGLTVLAILVVGFSIHRRNRIIDSDTTTLKPGKTDIMSEFYSQDSRDSVDDTESPIILRKGSSFTPTRTPQFTADNSDVDDMSEVPFDDFDRKIYYFTQDETYEIDRDQNALYDFSQFGMSINLTSSDGTHRRENNLHSRPSNNCVSPTQLEDGGAHEDEQSWIAEFENRCNDDLQGNDAEEAPETPTERYPIGHKYGYGNEANDEDEEGRAHECEQSWIAEFDNSSNAGSSRNGADELSDTPRESYLSGNPCGNGHNKEGDDKQEWTPRLIKTSPGASLIMTVANEILGDNDRDKNDVVPHSITATTIDPEGASTSKPREVSMLMTPTSKLRVNTTTSRTREDTPGEKAEHVYGEGTISPPPQFSIQNQQKTTPPTASVFTPSAVNSKSSQDGENVSSSRLSSTDSIMKWGFFKTPSPTSLSPKEDPPTTIDASIFDSAITPLTTSSPLSDEASTRTDFLKSRRRELEERFLEYKQKLSTSASEMNELSTTGAVLAVHAVSQHVDENEGLSPSSRANSGRVYSVTPSCVRLGSSRKGGRIVSPGTPESTNRTLLSKSSSASKNSRRRRSRTPIPPRRRQKYTSLNDIEDLLDQDQEWKLPDEKDAEVTATGNTQKDNLNAFLSSRSYAGAVPLQYKQFNADTVQL